MLDEPLVKRLYATSGSIITWKWHLAGRGGTYSYLGQQVWGEGLRGVCIFCAHTPPREVVLGALTIPGINNGLTIPEKKTIPEKNNNVMHHNDMFDYEIQHSNWLIRNLFRLSYTRAVI